jgi:hypothetical protein
MSMRRNLSPLVREDLRLRFKRRIAFLSLVGAVLFATVSQAGCQRIGLGKEAGSEAADTNAQIQAINSIISAGAGKPLASTKRESAFGEKQFGSPRQTHIRTREWRISAE